MDRITDFYRQFIGPDDLVFDIGANIGERTEVFAQLARKVIAVEPITASFLKIQAAPNPKVYAVHCAVGEASGMVRLLTSSQAPTIGTASMNPEWRRAVVKSGRFPESHWDVPEIVTSRTLDYLIASYGHPAFIKLDVEGSELQALRGLSKPVKAISFEWHPETIADTFQCIDRCVDLGMLEFAISVGETFEFDLGAWANDQITKERLEKHTGNKVYGDVYARS